MREFEPFNIVPVLAVTFGITAGWLVVGVCIELWDVNRGGSARRRVLPRWLRTAVVSVVAIGALPRSVSAADHAVPSLVEPDEESSRGGIDPLLVGSLATNAGFAAFHVRRHLVRLRGVRFGGSRVVADDEQVLEPPVPLPRADWRVVVRVLGPPTVESVDGSTAAFDKGKALELVVWMAEHRDNSTRSAARTALWDGDVKDSTFSNVVSEARRALQKVDPLIDEEWIPRTFSDDLPLHRGVVTDSQLLEIALQNFNADAGTYRDDLIEALRGVRNLPFSGSNYGWADGEGITTSHVIRVVKAAVCLAEYAIECDDNGLLFMATERGLRVLPGHEELVSLRIKGHARSGNRSAIKYEWESYARAIEADSWAGATPSPELEQLARELSRT